MSASTNVYSELYPSWLIGAESVRHDIKFWELIAFFVIHSPCDGQSWQSHKLHEAYGWKINPWNSPNYLKEKIIHTIWPDGNCKLYMAETREQFASKIYGKNLESNYTEDLFNQRAGYVRVKCGKNNDNQIMSLFYHIRNSFAHGRFGVFPIDESDCVFALEDGAKSDHGFEVTARIIIRESALISIKSLIEKGPDEVPNYAEEIIASIRRGNSKKRDIIDDIGITENIWKAECQRLKIEGKIRSEKKSWYIAASN